MDDIKNIHEDPWLAHIPLNRAVEILSNVLYASRESEKENLDRVICSLCISSSDFPQGCLNILENIPNDSPAWNEIVEAIESGSPVTYHIQVETYKRRPQALEKHLRDCFIILKEASILELNKLSEIYSSKEKVYSYFLGHSCGKKTNISLVNHIQKSKYRLLPSILSCEKFFIEFLKVSTNFLESNNYSQTSIKVVKTFYSSFNLTNEEILYDTELTKIVMILKEVPCINCNPMVSSEEDLKFLTNEIEKFIKENVNVDVSILRTIFCLYYDWMVYLQYLPAIKFIFIHTNELLAYDK